MITFYFLLAGIAIGIIIGLAHGLDLRERREHAQEFVPCLSGSHPRSDG